MIDFSGKSVFLSGPMSSFGAEGKWNAPAFDKCEQVLRDAGVKNVFNPANDAPMTDEIVYPHEHYMVQTLSTLTEWVCDEKSGECRSVWDYLVLLDGWQESSGARMERDVALSCGICVVEWHDIVVA